jgi:hypothetical protein
MSDDCSFDAPLTLNGPFQSLSINSVRNPRGDLARDFMVSSLRSEMNLAAAR